MGLGCGRGRRRGRGRHGLARTSPVRAPRPPIIHRAPPTGLTVDDASAPLAVEGTPQFGWIVNDVDRGETQSGYQIVVATQPTTDPAIVTSCGRAVASRRISSRTSTR